MNQPPFGPNTSPPLDNQPPAGGYGPPAGYSPPAGGTAPVPPKPAGRPRWLMIGLGCLGLTILACVILGIGTTLLATNLTQPMATAGDTFMNTLKAGDYTQAFNLSTATLQSQVKDAAGLEAALKNKQPTSWSWTARSINNGVGRLEGSAAFADGTKGTATLELSQVGTDWKVSFADLK